VKRKLTIAIESGDRTCASKPGKFCPWVRTTHFGSRYHCGLFGKVLDDGDDGWLQRLPECLDVEGK
jgi:hypothetical protein